MSKQNKNSFQRKTEGVGGLIRNRGNKVKVMQTQKNNIQGVVKGDAWKSIET